MKIKLHTRNLLLAGVGLGLLAGLTAAGVAVSQVAPLPAVEWDVRRLDTLDRNVRRLERALTQRNSVGQPVLVEPDPEVIQLQTQVSGMDRRLADLEQTVQRMNAENERLTFQLDERGRESETLRTGLTRIEGRIRSIEEAAAAQAAAAQAAQQAATPSATAADPGEALTAAVQLTATDRQAGAEALADVAATWPNRPEGREAAYRLGDVRRSGNDHSGAVQAYAAALKDWPRDNWAGEITLRLARSLISTNRNSQACGALAEFNRRYAGSASADLKGVASQIGAQARCN